MAACPDGRRPGAPTAVGRPQRCRRGDVDDLRFHVVIHARMLHAVGSRRAHCDRPRQAVAYCREDRADLVPLDCTSRSMTAMPCSISRAIPRPRMNSAGCSFSRGIRPRHHVTVRCRPARRTSAPGHWTTPRSCYASATCSGPAPCTCPCSSPTRCYRPSWTRARRPNGDSRRQRKELVERIDAALEPGALQMPVPTHPGPARSHHGGVRGAGPAPLGAAAQHPAGGSSDAAPACRSDELELVAVQGPGPPRPAAAGRVPLGEPFPATVMSPALAALLRSQDQERVGLELIEHAPVDDYPRLLAVLAHLAPAHRDRRHRCRLRRPRSACWLCDLDRQTRPRSDPRDSDPQLAEPGTGRW